MINKIGIENFRVFKDYTEFDLAPITILTGPNNSGKSSILKLINLIRISINENNTLNTLLFNKDSFNLGVFKNSINYEKRAILDAKDEDLNIKVVLDFPLIYFDENFDLELTYRQMGEIGFIDSFKIFNSNRTLLQIKIVYLEGGDSYKSYINQESAIDYLYRFDLGYIKKFIKSERLKYPDAYKDELLTSYYNYYKSFDTTEWDNELAINKKWDWSFEKFKKDFDFINVGKSNENILNLFDFIRKNHPKTIKTIKNNKFLFYDYHDNDIRQNRSGNSLLNEKFKDQFYHFENEILNSFFQNDNYHLMSKNSDLFTDTFFRDWEITRWFDDFHVEGATDELQKYFDKSLIDLKASQLDLFLNLAKLNNTLFNEIVIDNINQSLKKLKINFNGFEFTSSQRGSRERILKNKSSSEIDKIIYDYFEIKNDTSEAFIQKSLTIMGIKGELLIERFEGAGSILFIKNGSIKTNIVDMGYGYSQIIPILINIVIKNHIYEAELSLHSENTKGTNSLVDSDIMKPTFIIEEPESNLHPNLQSKLADIFVLAYKTYNVNFILESHSEYLIRKFQYLAASKDITGKDVKIYYFNSDENVSDKEPKVKKIEINESGGLTDSFGPGFYDEATTLQFDLMKINKAQNN